jgi:hypothetical protein
VRIASAVYALSQIGLPPPSCLVVAQHLSGFMAIFIIDRTINRVAFET